MAELYKKKMNLNFLGIKRILLVVSILGMTVGGARDAHSGSTPKTVKTEKGLRFSVPVDWPVEEQNGIVAPIPIEEYITRKFRDITTHLERIDRELSIRFNDQGQVIVREDIFRQLKEINAGLEALSKEAASFKDQRESSKNTESQTKEVESSVPEKALFEEIKVLKIWLDDIERRLRSIEFHLNI